MRLQLQPMTLREARVFVARHHRHHDAPVGGLFAVAVSDGEQVAGVAVVGRPVSRFLDDGWTAEVTRCCVLEGFRNACSMLYAAAWRAARALGYRRLVTYTLAREPGGSLRAAGWREVGRTQDARGWDRPGRPRVDTYPLEQKRIWEAPA